MQIDGDGWTHLPLPDGAGLHVRLQRRDGRWVVTDLYVHAEQITSALLRKLAPARLEFAMETKLPPGLAGFLGDLMEQVEPDDDRTLGDLRAQLDGVTPGRPARRSRRKPLTGPDRKDPDGFYRKVAEAYREYAVDTRAPAKAIADEAGVPVTTAHRWVREARRRGWLGAGEKGKATR